MNTNIMKAKSKQPTKEPPFTGTTEIGSNYLTNKKEFVPTHLIKEIEYLREQNRTLTALVTELKSKY